MLPQSRLYALQSITVNSRIKQGLFLDVHGKKNLIFLAQSKVCILIPFLHCYIKYRSTSK